MKTVYFLESGDRTTFYRTSDMRDSRRQDGDIVDWCEIVDEEYENWSSVFEEDRYGS